MHKRSECLRLLEPRMWGIAGQAEKVGGACETSHLNLLVGTCRRVI